MLFDGVNYDDDNDGVVMIIIDMLFLIGFLKNNMHSNMRQVGNTIISLIMPQRELIAFSNYRKCSCYCRDIQYMNSKRNNSAFWVPLHFSK